MSYSSIFLNKNSGKVPTIVFLLVISFVSFFIVHIFSTKPMSSQASKKILRQLLIVNPSSNQVGVFWQTDKKEIGWLVYGEKDSRLDKIALDEKDAGNNKTPYLNHYAIIKNLNQQQSYFFKIVSDNQLVVDSNNRPFSFRTTANIAGSSNISPAYGKVLGVNGIPLSSGVVVLTFKNSYPLFSLLKLSGEWLIPLNNIIDKSTQKVKNLENGEFGTIEIYNEEGQKSSIEIITENLSPLPQTVIIGKDYSFINKESVLAVSSKTSSKNQGISILFPKEQGIIPGETPLIKGTALPGADVVVIINSQVSFSTRVKADKDGIWRVVPKERLSAGEHQLTIVTNNGKGEEVKLTRRFTIAKSGEQVLGYATPEPSLTEKPTPTIINPTLVISTLSPTIKQAGSNPLPLTIISSSLIVIGLGIILAF